MLARATGVPRPAEPARHTATGALQRVAAAGRKRPHHSRTVLQLKTWSWVNLLAADCWEGTRAAQPQATPSPISASAIAADRRFCRLARSAS